MSNVPVDRDSITSERVAVYNKMKRDLDLLYVVLCTVEHMRVDALLLEDTPSVPHHCTCAPTSSMQTCEHVQGFWRCMHLSS